MDDLPQDRLDFVRRKPSSGRTSLTDFGPKNTLLHYKDSKTLTVDITEGDPEQLRQFLGGRNVRLSALIRDPEKRAAASVRMRGLRRRAQLLAEEQGIEVGRVAHGLLKVQPAVTGGTTRLTPLRAPLLLQPVRTEPRTSAETDYLVDPNGEVEINPVLLVTLHRHYGVDFNPGVLTAELNQLVADVAEPEERLNAVVAALTEVIDEQPFAIELERSVVIGCFNFDKMPMVQDLRGTAELLAEHDVVAAAAGYAPAVVSLRTEARRSSSLIPTRLRRLTSSLCSTLTRLSTVRRWPSWTAGTS